MSGCGKRFTEYSSLYKHHVVHTHSKPYICNHCGKNYRQTSTLAMHKRTAHGDDSSVEPDAALLLQQTEGKNAFSKVYWMSVAMSKLMRRNLLVVTGLYSISECEYSIFAR